MLLDSSLMFDPVGTAVTVTRVSTNIIDLLNARDLGVGDDPALKVTVVSDGLFAAAGAATLQMQFQSSPDNATWYTHAETAALSIAQLNNRMLGNTLFPIDVPVRPPGVPLPRYWRLNYIVATGPFTAGAVGAFVNIGRDAPIAYPTGFSTANI